MSSLDDIRWKQCVFICIWINSKNNKANCMSECILSRRMDAKHVDSSQPNLLGAIAPRRFGATNLLFLVHSPWPKRTRKHSPQHKEGADPVHTINREPWLNRSSSLEVWLQTPGVEYSLDDPGQTGPWIGVLEPGKCDLGLTRKLKVWLTTVSVTFVQSSILSFL